ncbi:MAG: hypothetical protein RLZZ15_3299 [Verrucomicrobiota bacterium]|jgi:hypothetical protein
MIVRVLAHARVDLVDGYWFYEAQAAGLGDYFLARIYEDLARLGACAGLHRKIPSGHHRMISRRFPFAIYYRVAGGAAEVDAILDCRRAPAWIQRRLRE